MVARRLVRSPVARTVARSLAKRGLRWLGATLAAQLDPAGTTTTFDALGGMTTAEKDQVDQVVRVHLAFDYSSDSANHVFGRFGLVVVTDNALAIGSSSVPNPISDVDDRWLTNMFFADEIAETVGVNWIPVDVRVRRNILNGHSLMFSMAIDAASTANTHWSVGMRILLRHA